MNSASFLNIAFAGTPEFAAVALQAVIDAGFRVSLVLTQPDRPAGRGMKLVPSPVKQLALQHNISIDQPEHLRTAEQQQQLRDCHPDILLVAAYGLLLPPEVLALPRLGCINIHASLLPRWRGAAPIHRAIEAGDKETGITIMQMDKGLDTGPVLAATPLAISPEDTTGTLHDRLATLGGEMIVETLKKLCTSTLTAAAQETSGATYAQKISKAEAQIDWAQDAETLSRQIRAFNPFPGSVTFFSEMPIKIWEADVVPGSAPAGTILSADEHGIIVASGINALRITVLQKTGSRRMTSGEFLRGFTLKTGNRFDSRKHKNNI